MIVMILMKRMSLIPVMLKSTLSLPKRTEVSVKKMYIHYLNNFLTRVLDGQLDNSFEELSSHSISDAVVSVASGARALELSERGKDFIANWHKNANKLSEIDIKELSLFDEEEQMLILQRIEK